MTIYFKQPHHNPVKVKLIPHRFGPNGRVIVESDDQRIWFALGGNIADLVAEFRMLANRLEDMACTKAEESRLANSWGWLTPDAVIEYFAQSPVLSHMLDDVKEALSNQPQSSQLEIDIRTINQHLDKILDDNGDFVHGYQSRIAEALGVTNAGSHRPRILAVAEALKEAA